MNEAIEACKTIFNIKGYVAQGIVPVLRLEDAKIAFARSLQRISQEKKHLPVPAVELQKKIQNLNYHYNYLTSYIRENNKEVALALELFEGQTPHQDQCRYLFPRYDKSHSPANSSVKNRDYRYKGKIMPNRMRFGTYLYYRGAIGYLTLMQSLAWQKNQRPLLGQIAMQTGFITPEEFAIVMLHVKNGFTFGEVAKKNKFISELTIHGIVQVQSRYDCRLGKFFINQKLFNEKEVEKYLMEMFIHNKRYVAQKKGVAR